MTQESDNKNAEEYKKLQEINFPRDLVRLLLSFFKTNFRPKS